MWRSISTISRRRNRRVRNLRSLSTQPWATRLTTKDEGDWSYSSEWWETTPDSRTILRSTSEHGNGVVSVVAHPCSTPDAPQWRCMEHWLQRRYAEINPGNEKNGIFRVLGYQWRVLHFNDSTRQSAVKIMAACRTSAPSSVYIMQQPHILAVPYLKSMVSVGMAALASCSYDLRTAVCGEKPMCILCIGHGGGSLPLFLASKIQGATVHVVELDPLVVSTSIQAMGFPAFAKLKPSGERAVSAPKMIDEVMWKGTHERLFVYELDAAEFILNPSNVYDLVFIDAYDGDDIFPRKLWDPHGQFLENLRSRLHPEHGTVVVNLHADSDVMNSDEHGPISSQHLLPMGKYVSRVCQAYKETLVGDENCSKGRGSGFVASVPWLCNSSLVVCRGFEAGGMFHRRDSVVNKLLSKSQVVEDVLNLPFSCLEYIKGKIDLVG